MINRLNVTLGGILSAALLFAALLWLFDEQAPTAEAASSARTGIILTVIKRTPGDARIDINTTGISTARWPMEITAAVSGRIKQLMPAASPGKLVQEGEALANLQDSLYQAELQAAKARVAQAELQLEELHNRQRVAKTNGNPRSAFGRLEPHIKAAKADLDAAKTALASAQQQLDDTRITAPFNAVLIAELAPPGRWVSAGEAVFRIASSDFVDIKVALPQASWQRLSTDLATETEITVTTADGQQWPASIRYLSPDMDALTRQRQLVLEVAKPFQREKPLLANQQLDVRIAGAMQSQVVRAPTSVVTEDGKVWAVVDNALRQEEIELLQEEADAVLFRFKKQSAQTRLLVEFPRGGFLEGQPVADIQERG